MGNKRDDNIIARVRDIVRQPLAAAAALLLLAPLSLFADSFNFKGQTVEFENAEHFEGADAQTGQPVHFLVFRQDGWFKPASTARGRALVVGGGGAGGYGTTDVTNPGGGGGGGQVIDQKDLAYIVEKHTVTVGAGGAQKTSAGNGANGNPSKVVAGETVLASALGGGGGGSKSDGSGGDSVGTGGGGSGLIKRGVYGQGGVGALGADYKGGNATATDMAAGGGGTGGAGANSTATKAGDGGVGYTLNVEIWAPETLGVPTAYGGGGGGAQSKNDTAETAGSGKDGGGRGGYQGTAGADATAYSGGGGGGGGRGTSSNKVPCTGGAGGSGIVIIRFEDIEVTIDWISIPVKAGGNEGKIFVDSNASWSWQQNGDLLIAYSNTTIKGGLAFFNPTNATEELPPVWAKARVLAVGGGGGGGFVNVQDRGGGGGGGAGGFVEEDGLLFDNNFKFSIEVGAGGVGGAVNDEAGKPGGKSSVTKTARNDETQVENVVDDALGGGGGGARSAGGDGGSGGGGSLSKDKVVMPGGLGKSGQGCAGGTGSGGYKGAGGGGASQEGEVATDDAPGKGGDGRESDICGTNVCYAGGGGGASVNPKNWNDWSLGAKGGKGGGGHGAGAKGGKTTERVDVDPDPAESGADGLGGGGGGGSTHEGATSPAGNGGSGVVIIRLSGFVVDNIPLPVPKGPFTYDGNAHTGVVEFFAYKLTGTPVATNADVYSVTATIPGDAPYEWADGGKGDRTVSWEINPLAVAVPEVNAPPPRANYFTFGNAARDDEEEKLAINADLWSLKKDRPGYPGETCATTVVAKTELPYCVLTGHRETNAGEYHFTATLVTTDPQGNFATNFVWKTPSSILPQSRDWTIEQAENEITELALANWQEGTAAKTPSSTWQWSKASARYAHPDKVVYSWRKEGTKDWSDPKVKEEFVPPTEYGPYELRAYICKDSNHAPGNWRDAEKIIRFYVWRHPSKLLTDYVDITIAGNSSATKLENFPVLVRLAEPVDSGKGGGLPGFTYARAGNGSELRFVSLPAAADYNKRDDAREDKSGDVLLPYEVDTWDTAGESLVWVRIPTIVASSKTTKFRMYWHRRASAEMRADALPAETWSAYAGVWHMNRTSDGTIRDSSGNGRDAHLSDGASLEYVDGPKGGTAVKVTGGNLVAPNPQVAGSANNNLTFSAWYRCPGYKTDTMFAGTKLGAKSTGEMKTLPGWCMRMGSANNRVYWSVTNAESEKNGIGWNLQTTWGMLAFGHDGASSNGAKKLYGTSKEQFTGSITGSDSLLQLATDGFEADEVRIATTYLGDDWVKQAYYTLNTADYCTFGLVSQMQADGQPSWVNWWTKEPTLKRYWDKNELTTNAVNEAHGSLAAGTITNMFTKMPEGRPVDFPKTDEVGAYIVEFAMLNMDLGVTTGSPAYPGRHLLFDGTRTRDLEIVDHAPSPIDPGGPEGATRSGRVLTANDDTNTARAVALQSYWRTHETDPALNPFWRHVSGPVLDLGLNIRPKSTHALCLASDDGTKTNDLWILHEVYIGNMMTNDAAATGDNTVLSNRWNTLPWSETSKAITAKDAPFNHTEVGQLLMRNRDDADIESGVFTNGVGTLYFDAVNAYALSDVKPADYKLVVEYDDPMTDGTNHWRTAQMTVLSVTGATITQRFASTNELSCLNVRNGGKVKSFSFYRAYAKLNRRVPTRVRIRRTSIRKNEGGVTTGDDDPDGFIALDNIIVSWPAPVPRIVPTGSYDATRLRAKAPVLGTEGAFSIAYPSVGETFYANVRLEGGAATNVASARFNYRWRYADTEFRPARQSGRDTWGVGYFNVTGETFSTMAPIPAGAVVGDIEYWFDLTAFAPYYTYVDYTGLTFPKGSVLGYSEEPPKNMPSVADPAEYLPDPCYPSHGTNWFVRLREWANPGRGWWLLYKTSADGEVKRLALEMTDAREWRVCLPTRTPLEKLYVRFESESPAGTDAQGIHFTTNLWAAESSAALPKRLALTKGSAAWATVSPDAKSGHLMFLVSEEEGKESVMVSRADWQDFNMWTSGVNTNGLFAGSSVDTNATSSVTQESEADLARWPVSVATNSSWTLKFDAPSVVAAIVYPRYEPFSSKYVNGWTLENGMWTYGKWSLQNQANPLTSLGDDSALQMTGRGYGRLSFTEAAKSPDGLDTVSYKARVAQFNEFENVTYYNTWIPDVDPVTHVYRGGEMSIDMTDYTFATCAALTAKEGGAALYDGDGSVSLFAYYRPKVGAYEFRVSRGWNETSVRLALYRWRSEGGAMVCEKLQDAGTEFSGYKKNYFDYDDAGETGSDHKKANINRMVKGSISPLGGLFISVTEKDGATLVTAGLRKDDVNVVTGMEQEFGSQSQYACIVYRDKEQDKRLTSGSFGVLACNCPGVFVKPLFWKKGIDSVTPSADNVLEKKADQTFTFTDAPNTDCRDATLKSWAVEDGRTEKLVSANNYFGFQAKAPLPQKVVVQIAESGTSNWKDVYTNEVNGFTSDSYPIVVRDARKCSVRLQSLGKPDDVRADVVLDDIELTQWNGQWTEHWDDGAAPWNYLTNSFVYTSAWIVEDGRGMKAVKLQPTRARNDSTPVSLRSSLLRGLGLIHFKWRNADPNAKIRVQYKENVPVNDIVAATETLASGATEEGNGWVDLETIPVGELGASGSHTSYINHRYNGKDDYGKDYKFGLIRIVIDKEVEAEAVKAERRRNDPEYGAVEITEAFARDLPEFDRFSWSGWNFRTAGWDGANPDPEFANFTDGFRGLSGLLNNTLDESTLADRETDHYRKKMPGIQSPVFLTNCIGAVSFRARLYGKDDLFNAGYAAVVTVLGTSVLENGEPKDGTWMEAGDVIVSNRVYGTHSVKIPAVKGFKAIRLVVKGVEGVTEPVSPGGVPPKPHYDPNPPLRVAIDDICIWERQSQSIAFRKLHVRPFRDATAIKGTGEVKDIAEMAEQPLIGEAFGFQAEVEVLDPEEVLVDDPAYPITVDLWYYQGSDVWGYENWKTNPAVVKVAGLTPATDGNGLVFRSTVEQSASLCPPQFLGEGEGYRIVQYHVVAHFYDKGHAEGLHDLLSDEWSMPAWNVGFPDPNGTHSAFSAFTLLEEIAPGRAWINEINYCEPSQSASLANQWIELAVPSGVDMTGWTVEAYDYNGEFVAELAALGLRGAAKQKTYRGSDPVALASHYAFYTIKSPYTVLDGADAVWPSFNRTGALDYSMPYAFALRRPTGVIEHRVVAQGWNQYKDAGYDFAWMYEGTNLVKVMERKHGGEWTWSAEDFHGNDDYNKGVSVITNQGFAHEDWVSPLELTPGEINGGQYISPDWYILPNGGYVKIYSSVLGSHMRQIIGGVTNTVGDLTISQGLSTNIVYEVDRWYKLGPYTVNPSERTAMSGPRGGADGKTYYTLSLNQVSNRIDITVRDDVSDQVTDMLDPKYDAYRPAIMKWLENGVTGGADGGEHPFKNPNGPLLPMHYRGTDGTSCDELKLPDLYWLDVDPTSGDWELWGGMGDRPGSPGTLGQVDCPTNRVKILADGSTFIHTNHLTTVWLELRNTNEEYAVSYPPYRIQGLGNEQSDLYTGVWTSGNFKVTMRLVNGKVDEIFQPMRYFVFDRNSFRAKDDPVAPYAARVEIVDPFSDQSPASEWGWQKYSDCNVFTGWALDGRVTPGGVSTLKKNDLLDF